MSVSIRNLDTTTADFAEGTLTDVEAVNDSLQLANNPALSFDGNDYVDIPYSFSFSTITVSFILNWDNLGTDNVEFVCEGDSNNKLMVHLGGGAGTNGIRFDLGGFPSPFDTPNIIQSGVNRYSITYDGSTASIYRNGSLINSASKTASAMTTNWLQLGVRGNSNSYYLNGLLDDFRLFDYALSETELNDIKYKELTGSETGLVAYYKMNEGTGLTLIDSAGSNDGTINGASWTDNYISWNLDGTGTRQSPQLDLSAVNDVASSSISWTETLNSQTITIETSVDSGSTWQTATNGGSIPNLTDSTSTLDVRQTLETTDTTVTPVLDSLEVDIDTAVVNEDTGVLQETDDEGSLKSILDNYNQEGWITNPKNTSQWTKVDENKENLWTKVEKNTADWKKVGGE
jgi:hypothetical protein